MGAGVGTDVGTDMGADVGTDVGTGVGAAVGTVVFPRGHREHPEQPFMLQYTASVHHSSHRLSGGAK